MASRLGACLGRNILLVLVALFVRSESLTGGPMRTRHCCSRRESFTRCLGAAAATAVDGRDGGKMRGSSGDPSPSGELGLEEMELWLDETGVDRRGGGKGTPSAKLRRFSGRGIGLEVAVDLERDSTVRRKPTRLYDQQRSCWCTLRPHRFPPKITCAVLSFYVVSRSDSNPHDKFSSPQSTEIQESLLLAFALATTR